MQVNHCHYQSLRVLFSVSLPNNFWTLLPYAASCGKLKIARGKYRKGSVYKPLALWLMTQTYVWFRMQLWLTFLEERFTASVLWPLGLLLCNCTELSKMGLCITSPDSRPQAVVQCCPQTNDFSCPGETRKARMQWNSGVAGLIAGLNFESIQKLWIFA